MARKMKLTGDYINLVGLYTNQNSDIVSISSRTFKPSSIGKTLIVYGAGQLGDELVGEIVEVINPNEVRLNKPASVTTQNSDGGFGTDNSTLFKLLVKSNKSIYFFKGTYYFKDRIELNRINNLTISGDLQSKIVFISSNPNSYHTGTQPIKSWINAYNCSGINISNLSFQNIGQTQSRIDPKDEGGFWTMLNDVIVPYNRRYNSRSNSGVVLYQTDCKDSTVTNCVTFDVGGLIMSSGDLCTGLKVTDCKLTNYCITGISTGHHATIERNIFDNSGTPVLGSSDINKTGTSHAIYVHSGYSNIEISNNKFISCREYAFQVNTNSTNEQFIELNNNHFINCYGSFYLTGKSTNSLVIFRNCLVENCDKSTIDSFGANTQFIDCQFIGSMYSAILICRMKSVTIDNCKFTDINKFFSGTGILLLPTANILGSIEINSCNFTNCNNSVSTMLNHDQFNGICSVKNSIFNNSRVTLGYQLIGTDTSNIAKGSVKKFIFDNCSFNTDSDMFVGTYGGTFNNSVLIGNCDIYEHADSSGDKCIFHNTIKI